MTNEEREWRNRWADYFDLRAKTSEENAESEMHGGRGRDHWIDVAIGEKTCARILRDDESVEKLTAELRKGHPTVVP